MRWKHLLGSKSGKEYTVEKMILKILKDSILVGNEPMITSPLSTAWGDQSVWSCKHQSRCGRAPEDDLGLCGRHDQNNDKIYAIVTSLNNQYFYQKPEATNNE